MNFAPLFSSQSVKWATPVALYDDLHREFGFTLDPCPIDYGKGDGALFGEFCGLTADWGGHTVFCNPPYGPEIDRWLEKSREAELAVFLLPARTDTRWFHDFVLARATEIRFVRGRIKFSGAKWNAPFPSCIAIFRNSHSASAQEAIRRASGRLDSSVAKLKKTATTE